jgi:HNH endonuclease.
LQRLIPDTHRSITRIVVHALIDLGRVTKLECSYKDCKLDTREFGSYPAGKIKGQKDAITVDHVRALWEGGTDRPENLRLMHWICNVSLGTSDARTRPELREKMSEALKERWRDPDYRAKQVGRPVSEETRLKRSEAMKRHWENPERRARHTARLSRGESHSEAHRSNELIKCDVCGKPCKGAQGLSLHKVRSSCGTNSS